MPLPPALAARLTLARARVYGDAKPQPLPRYQALTGYGSRVPPEPAERGTGLPRSCDVHQVRWTGDGGCWAQGCGGAWC